MAVRKMKIGNLGLKKGEIAGTLKKCVKKGKGQGKDIDPTEKS